MITLIQFPPAFGLPNPSPFCTKAEVLLKLAAQPYEVELTPDPRKGPKGKLPAIRDGNRLIGDSTLIRKHLEESTGVDLDAGLDARERAAAHAFCRNFEERLYWVIVYSRWVDEQTWPRIRREFFGGLPPILRGLIARQVRGKVLRDLRGQGLTLHAPEEIYAFGIDDLRAAAAWLADKPFFMGERPSSTDATVYPFLSAIALPDFDSPLRAEARRHDNLMAYVERCRTLWFP